MQTWRTYEQVATHLLDQFAAAFGLERVEGKQDVPALHSGTSWEIDARGVRVGDEGFVLVECRRYTTTRLDQESLGGLAWRIIDTGAEGGIIVSPHGLQAGAELVARTVNVVSVRLDANCNLHEYTLQFLNRVMVGIHDGPRTQDTVTAHVTRAKQDG